MNLTCTARGQRCLSPSFHHPTCPRYDRVMERKWLLTAATLAVLAIAASAFLYRKSHAPKPKLTPAPPLVVATLPPEISITGKIEATKIVSVPVPVDGIIEQLVADID